MSDIKEAKTLSEAIAILEKVGQSKVDDLKKVLEKDYTELKKNMDDLKPIVNDFRSKFESQVDKSKLDVEAKITNNPWVTLAIVGVMAFIIGCFFGNNKKDSSKDNSKDSSKS